MTNEKGFTLVEAMISAAILGAGILAMISLIERQNAARGGLQTQLNLRQVLNSAMSIYEANSNSFPPAAAAAGGGGPASARPLTYVGCFQSGGTATTNSVSSSAYVTVDLGASLTPDTTISGVCDCQPGGTASNVLANIEVHVVRTLNAPPAPNSISFYAFLLPPLKGGAAPCFPNPKPYLVDDPNAPRDWTSRNYLSAPAKVVQDSIDISTPP